MNTENGRCNVMEINFILTFNSNFDDISEILINFVIFIGFFHNIQIIYLFTNNNRWNHHSPGHHLLQLNYVE